MKKYELPASVDQWIQKYLKQLGRGPINHKELAKSVVAASDHYQDSQSTTPWKSLKDQAAYIAYFFPLNYIRLLKVIDEAKGAGLLDGVESVVDYGCGPGTATKALLNDDSFNPKTVLGVDSDPDVGKFFMDWPRSQTQLSFNTTAPTPLGRENLVVGSYVINEVGSVPPWMLNADRLILVEPSTRQMAPKYQELRSRLIKEGYQILAPCPHHAECPLNNSRRDWCHDRVHWQAPDWFLEIEKHLPMKNRTMTFSYLIATRKKQTQDDYTRVVGDAQVEKGKTRWMVCRSSEREFIGFLKRSGKSPLIYRGDKLRIQSEEKKGNEIRITNDTFTKIDIT